MSPFSWQNALLLMFLSVPIGLTSAGAPEALKVIMWRGWCIVLPGALGGVVAVLYFFPALGIANILSTVSLVSFPVLACFTLSWAMHGARWWLGVLILPLLVLGVFTGQEISTNVKDMSCCLVTLLSVVTLGRLIVGFIVGKNEKKQRFNLHLIRFAIVLTAVIDGVLVFTGILGTPNDNLNGGHPVLGAERTLPQLQDLTFFNTILGYEDVFLTAILGAVLTTEDVSLWKKWLVVLLEFAVGFLWSLLFLKFALLPFTPPTAITMLICLACGAALQGSDVEDGRLSSHKSKLLVERGVLPLSS